MANKRAQALAATLVRDYFTARSMLPELWDDVVGDTAEEWEAVRDALAPEIEHMERRRERLYTWLHSYLSKQTAHRVLQAFDENWRQLRTAEADLAFTLGIEVGKYLVHRPVSIHSTRRRMKRTPSNKVRRVRVRRPPQKVAPE